jgi:1-acyl-sn-glycerol-3-phosphate acyltransferase
MQELVSIPGGDQVGTMPGLETDRTVTDWGRSERLVELCDRTLLRFLYDYWFRVEVEGLEHVPERGAALLVANRAGPLPLDGAMIARAIREERRLHRTVHLTSERSFADVPGIGMALTKLGGVWAHPANLHRLLLDEQELVLVFPEGAGAGGKRFAWRYRLRRFDRIPFVQAAVRAGAPIVPVAVLGSEESQPTLVTLASLGRVSLRIGSPLPLPAKLRVRFLPAVRPEHPGGGSSDAAGWAEDLADGIRGLIQENLVEMVAGRRSVWLG